MKKLTLIRHTKSTHDNLGLRDFQRPLSQRGIRDASLLGQHLKAAFNFAPDAIIASPAIRAATTAAIILREAGLCPGLLTEDRLVYEAPLCSLVNVVRRLPDTARHVTLFGHNPGFELLANWLCGARIIDRLRTGGVVMLQLDLNQWALAELKSAQLITYFYPAQIGGGKDAPVDAS